MDTLTIVIGVGTVLGGMGYAAGQFISSRRRGLQDSLTIALAEITLLNGKLTRLEAEMGRMSADLEKLQTENKILRSVITKAVEENQHG
jgi:hypothetical protein